MISFLLISKVDQDAGTILVSYPKHRFEGAIDA